MVAASKKLARYGLFRRSAMLAVLAPVLFLAACAQERPPPPAPVQAAPPPAPVPAVRG